METVQDLKVETESPNKMQTEMKLEIKILQGQTKTSDVGLNNRQDREETI